jgi:chemotaxis protein methyltransferase CheR
VTLSEQTVSRAQHLVADRLGLEFTEQRRTELERGLHSACRTSGAAGPDQYLARLAVLPAEDLEWRRLAGRLTTGETYFFRDRACFEALERDVLPGLIAARRTQGIRRLRLWSAGCASGEEPHSLAILLDRLLPDRTDWHLTVLATDISGEALERARQGVYRQWSLRDTPSWVRDRYFQQTAEGLELDPEIRRMVVFAPLNLASTTYPALATNTVAMDVVFCRNVLMYFTRATQRAVVERLQTAVGPGGWLVVAPVEASAELLAPFVPVSFPGAILYARSSGARLPRPVLPDEPAIAPLIRPAAPFSEDATRREKAPPTSPAKTLACSATLLQRARSAADAGELEQAGELCRAALALDRLNPEAHLLLAEICHELAEVEAALDELRAAIYLAPNSASAHFLLGSLLVLQGEPKRGRRSLETALTLLSAVPPDEALPDGDGLLAGELAQTVRAHLELA